MGSKEKGVIKQFKGGKIYYQEDKKTVIRTMTRKLSSRWMVGEGEGKEKNGWALESYWW